MTSTTEENNLKGAILGLCNPLLDISAVVPLELFSKYDLKLNNAILAEESHYPLYSELVRDFPVEYIAGGATQNSIRVAQWMIKIPGSTSYFGAIGQDSFGEKLEQCAREDGVLVHYQKNPLPTGTCAVLLNGGERSLVANLSAANSFTASHLETPLSKEIISKAKIFYVSGFFHTVSVESILILAKHSSSENKILALNLSAPFVIQFFGSQLAASMLYADYVFGNESEALVYGEVHNYGSDISSIALKIAAQSKANGTRPRIVVITQGSDSTIVASGGVITKYPVEALPPALLVDTNGAGDAFVGGFLAMLALGKPIEECVRAAHYAARVIIQRSGCTFPKECGFV